jgi:ATP-dependent exoDNAse (exonuclease V) beta subunit
MGLAAHAVLERLDFGVAGHASSDELGKLIDAAGVQSDLSPTERNDLWRDLSRYLAEVSFPREAPCEHEVPFFLQIGDAPALFVRGRIDLVCITANRIKIRDYKYARPRDTAAYQLQMEIYALAVAEAYPEHELAAELVFLRDAPSVVPVALPPLESIRSRLHGLAREFIASQTSDNWSKRPPNEPACHQLGCGYILRCWAQRG